MILYFLSAVYSKHTTAIHYPFEFYYLILIMENNPIALPHVNGLGAPAQTDVTLPDDVGKATLGLFFQFANWTEVYLKSKGINISADEIVKRGIIPSYAGFLGGEKLMESRVGKAPLISGALIGTGAANGVSAPPVKARGKKTVLNDKPANFRHDGVQGIEKFWFPYDQGKCWYRQTRGGNLDHQCTKEVTGQEFFCNSCIGKGPAKKALESINTSIQGGVNTIWGMYNEYIQQLGPVAAQQGLPIPTAQPTTQPTAQPEQKSIAAVFYHTNDANGLVRINNGKGKGIICSRVGGIKAIGVDENDTGNIQPVDGKYIEEAKELNLQIDDSAARSVPGGIEPHHVNNDGSIKAVTNPVLTNPVLTNPIVANPIVANPVAMPNPMVANPIVANPVAMPNPMVANPIVANPVGVAYQIPYTATNQMTTPMGVKLPDIPGLSNLTVTVEQ